MRAITHFHSHLYGHSVTVYTDHTAVKAVLETPNPSGRHVRWWTKVYGLWVGEVKIVYRSGKSNTNADALSRSPVDPAPTEGLGEGELQVAAVTCESGCNASIPALLASDPKSSEAMSFGEEQRRDDQVMEVIQFLEDEELPPDPKRAQKVAAQQHLFTMVDGVLYFVDPKQEHRRRAVMPKHLQEQILGENRRQWLGGHFFGRRMYGALMRHWWREGMYLNTQKFTRNCPECATVTGGGRPHRPPLHVISVQRPFQLQTAA